MIIILDASYKKGGYRMKDRRKAFLLTVRKSDGVDERPVAIFLSKNRASALNHAIRKFNLKRDITKTERGAWLWNKRGALFFLWWEVLLFRERIK